MKVRVPASGNTYHVENAIGSLLADCGLVEVLPNAGPTPPAKVVEWKVGQAYSGLPFVKASCPVCKTVTQMERPVDFVHCGRKDFPPEDVRQQFEFLTKRVAKEDQDPSVQDKPARGPIQILERPVDGEVEYVSSDPVGNWK